MATPSVSEKDAHVDSRVEDAASTLDYTLNKWRFPGVLGLVILNLAGGLSWPWFGSISTQTSADFHISINQVNWLGNVVSLVFLPASIATTLLCSRYGTRGCCFMSAALLAIAGWVRVAGTASGLSPQGAYALLLIGQVLSGIAQPAFQVSGPRFSEAWFDFNGRTTATMVISVANPVGSALGQLFPSLVASTRFSILILAIISTAAFPAAFLIYSQPPSPPTYSGSQPAPPPLSTIRALIGRPRGGARSFPLRARLDFAILTFSFGIYVAAANGLSLLTAQLFGPYGYSSSESGLFGATLILAGLVATAIMSPLLDRVFTRYTTMTLKVATPLLGLSWLSLIWAVRPNNTGGLFAVMAIAGVISLTLLPLTLEIACELVRDAETSAAILWSSSNVLTVVFVLVEDALTAGADASPPFNMRNASIFVAAFTCAAAFLLVLGFRGLAESRRSLDAARESAERATKEIE
ncbi:MFS general substrate transporter [Gautieria morchelliformis]|nr:MFS general substrate transporter [Gautieria morchelliformis]